MLELKQTITISVFSLFCLFSIYYSGQIKWEEGRFTNKQSGLLESNPDNFFQKLDFYTMKGDKKTLHLNASELSFNSSTEKVVFFNPVGVAYSSSSQIPMDYVANRGLYNKQENHLTLVEDVKVNSPDSNLVADRVDYFAIKDWLLAEGKVKTDSFNKNTGDKIFIQSDKMDSFPKSKKSHYAGKVKGRIKRKRVYEESVHFKSQDLRVDFNNNVVSLEGDVFIKKQGMTAKSLKGDIFLENYNKKLKYFALYDDVRVEEKLKLDNGEVIQRRALSEKLEGIASEDKIILTGYPKVFQQGDIIKGNKIVLRENNEVIEVDDANTNFLIK